MKKILFILVLMGFFKPLNAQSKIVVAGIPYYDAIQLKKLLKKPDSIKANIDSIQAILSYYFRQGKPIPNPESDVSIIGKDSCIYKLISDWTKQYKKFVQHIDSIHPGVKGSSSQSSSANPLGSIGGFDVTNIADGIAQFLVKRGKEELDIAFFSKMKTFLTDPAHPEYATIFPATAKFMENIEAYQYSELLQSLRESFQQDLNNLVVNLAQLMDLPKYNTLTNKFPEIRIALQSAKIVSSLSQSKKTIKPDSIIHLLAQMKDVDKLSPNMANSLQLLYVISQSLRDSNRKDSAIWITYNEFSSNILNNDTTLDIYLGLLSQKASNIKFISKNMKDTTSVQGFINKHFKDKDINTLSDLAENFLTLANNVESTMSDYNKKKVKGGITNNDVYTYLNQAIDVIQYGFKAANTIKPGVAKDEYILIAQDGIDLYKNIATKTYNAAIKDVSDIITEVDSLTVPLTVSSNTQAATFKKDISDISKVASNVLKYGNLMASIINAKSSDDVDKAIEAAALPAGSYSIKRTSHWNIAINGYIGGGYDIGNPFGSNPAFVDERNQYNLNWVMYAPIGFSFSLGSKCNCGSATIFIPLVDVGGIANFRLYNDSATLNEKVTLASIFSPGATFIYGVPGFPLSVSIGLLYKPALIYDAGQSTLVNINGMWRFNASLLIDIPFFNILNKTR